MEQFEILITSPPDRGNLVAEIWHSKNLIAEINQEKEELEIEFYLHEKKVFKLSAFIETLKIAKNKLLDG